MGGFVNSLFGQTGGLSQALQVSFPSLSMQAQMAGASPTAASGGAGESATGTATDPVSGVAAAGGASGTTASGGASPSGVSPSPAQIAQYRTGVEGALSSAYGRVAQAAQPYTGQTPTPAAGEMLLEEYAPHPSNVPALTAEQASLLGPAVGASWPWGPGIWAAPGSNVSSSAGVGQLLSAAGANPSDLALAGSAPGSYFPTDVFGNVAGSPTSLPGQASQTSMVGTGDISYPATSTVSLPSSGGAALAGSAPASVFGNAPQWAGSVPSLGAGGMGQSPWEAVTGPAPGAVAEFGG